MPTFPDPTIKSLGGGTAALLPQSPLATLAAVAKLVTVGGMWTAQEAFTDNTYSIAVSDGGSVFGLRDMSGNQFHASNATANQQPILRSKVMNGRPGLDWSGSAATELIASNAFTGTGYSAGWTVYVVANAFKNPILHSVLWLKDTNNFLTLSSNIGNGSQSGLDCKINSTQVTMVCDQNDTYGVYTMSWDGVTATIGYNGRFKTASIAGSPPTTGDSVLCNVPGSPPANGLPGFTGVHILCPGAHSQATQAQVVALLAQAYSVPPVDLFVGDSITLGLNLTVPAEQCWGHQFEKLLGATPQTVAEINNGVSGQTLAVMASLAASSPDQTVQYANSSRNLFNRVFIWGGTNDMSLSVDNQTAAVAFSRLQALVAIYRPIAKYLYVITCIPRDATDAGASFAARRTAFNASILADTTMGLDGVIDVGGDSRWVLGLSGAGLYQAGDIHPNHSGAALAALLVSEVVGPTRDTTGILATAAFPPIPVLSTSAVTGAGTAYSLTSSLAAVTFGTTSPTLALPPGTYLLTTTAEFTGATAADDIQLQLFNSTGSAAIGITAHTQSALTGATNIAVTDLVTLTAPSTVTIRMQNATGARGTVVAAATKLTAVRIG